MQQQISIREANQNFTYYVKLVEDGDEVIITRHNVPIARLTPISTQKSLSSKQLQARARILMLMQEGLALGGGAIDRDSLHDR